MQLDPMIHNELLSYVGQLGSDDQARVLDFARALAESPKPKRIGVPGKELLRFAGTIPHEDLEEMKRAIEEGCEQIDHYEW